MKKAIVIGASSGIGKAFAIGSTKGWDDGIKSSDIPNRIPEEKVLWSLISEINSEELTPFAKQAWLNNFFRKS